MQTKLIKILIVEDNPSDFLILRQHLKASNVTHAEPDHTKSVAETLEILKIRKPDVIILDLFLPDSESLDTFMRVHEAATSVPIIILSSTSDFDSAVQAIKLGAQDYIFKTDLDSQCLSKSIAYSIERKITQETLQNKIHDAVICSQEAEKEELGKELHDNVNQILASCKLYLEVAIKDKKKRVSLLPKSFDYLNIAMQEIRKLSKSLVAPSFDHVNIGEALIELLEAAEANTITNYTLIDDFKNLVELPGQFQLAVYRIAHEQLQNIAKHAKAKTVVVRLFKDENSLHLEISDDGVGFNTDVKFAGIGLRNIKSRVDSQQGELKLISSPRNGCTLHVVIPLRLNSFKLADQESMAV